MIAIEHGDDPENAQGIWVPKLVFSNTEEKDNTLNDDKAFTVARYNFVGITENSFFDHPRRDSLYEVSEDTAKDNIYIFEVSPHKAKLKRNSQTKCHCEQNKQVSQGRTNPFVLSRVYDVEWVCEYDMRW